MEFTKIWDTVTQCWQVKLFASLLIFLVGDISAPFIAIWILLLLDTVTRLIAISKKHLETTNLLKAVVLSFRDGDINSKGFRQFVLKCLSYLILMIVANLFAKVVPNVLLMGANIAQFPCSFIYTFLAITEAMSIVENLVEVGVENLKPLLFFISKKRDEMTGGDK